MEINHAYAPSRELVVEQGYEFTGETRQPTVGDLFWNGTSVWERVKGTGTIPRPILRVSGSAITTEDSREIEKAYAQPAYDI